MKEQSTERAAESRPVWEGLEAFARRAVQRLLQQVLEEQVEEALGRRRYERRELDQRRGVAAAQDGPPSSGVRSRRYDPRCNRVAEGRLGTPRRGMQGQERDTLCEASPGGPAVHRRRAARRGRPRSRARPGGAWGSIIGEERAGDKRASALDAWYPGLRSSARAFILSKLCEHLAEASRPTDPRLSRGPS
jgi:hypothetical protein